MAYDIVERDEVVEGGLCKELGDKVSYAKPKELGLHEAVSIHDPMLSPALIQRTSFLTKVIPFEG